jgi:predicted metal-dependent hydrolase
MLQLLLSQPLAGTVLPEALYLPCGQRVPLQVQREAGRRSVVLRVRNGQLEVRVPARLGAQHVNQVISPLLTKVEAQLRRQHQLLQAIPTDVPRCGFTTTAQVLAYAQALNHATFQHAEVRLAMGRARLSRMGVYSARTGVITLSWFALASMPMPAVRYLLLHELAHRLEMNHSPRFWAQVARFEPRYAYWGQVLASGFTYTTNGWAWPDG